MIRKSIRVKPKRRGRPATGKDPLVGARLPPNMIREIDQWASRNSVSRSEAIRRLVERSLAKETRFDVKDTEAKRAQELADHTAERIIDKSIPFEEQERRKRALIKGPKEFREMREDLPKPKR
jgi:Arc/MetJ-type ribon-helix-helix transcriptional regulator